jgi:hypothetical protein
MKDEGTVDRLAKPSFWQLVFLQSKVNGAPYDGEKLPGHNWNWPKDTYFQRRLRYVRFCRAAEAADFPGDSLRENAVLQAEAA